MNDLLTHGIKNHIDIIAQKTPKPGSAIKGIPKTKVAIISRSRNILPDFIFS
ncbi:MAG: hypothetical protein QM725_16835 [Lacibacter sp.]